MQKVTGHKVPFLDRASAGKDLAIELEPAFSATSGIVLALPRGGVPVAFAVAEKLELELDIILVRKLGMPGHDEFAMGAIASGGVDFLDDDVVRRFHISKTDIEKIRTAQQTELRRRESAYRGNRPYPNLKNRLVILVDDGLATGASMKVAISAARRLGAGKIVVAIPVAPRDSLQELRPLVDDLVCLATPEPFQAVGLWYKNFAQVTDDEVCRLLSIAWKSKQYS